MLREIKFQYFIVYFMCYFIDEDCSTVKSRLTRTYINIQDVNVFKTIKHVDSRICVDVYIVCVVTYSFGR